MTLSASLSDVDHQLVRRACAGERGALTRLVGLMQRPFYNLALRMLSDRSAAEDATQESLLRVVTHLSQYRSEAKFSTWATRIAVNAVLDFKSGVGRQARYGFDEFTAGLAAARDDRATEKPDDALVLKEAKTLCSRALLQCLDGNHRTAFVLGEILEFDADEAAQILDVLPATFRKRLSRARAEITDVLSRNCSVHTPGAPCACHRTVASAIASNRIDPSALEVRIGDLAKLKTRLTVLQAEPRTRAMYQGDEVPDLRDEVMAKVRLSLFQMSN